MSFKKLFSRSLAANPDRLHFAAHSHHLWPDASYSAQVEAWNDAAELADQKWDKVMAELWPRAQREVAAELATGSPDAIVFAPNTHDLLVRLFTAAPRTGRARVLTSDGEFHSARRQLARWADAGDASVEQIPVEPFDTFSSRFLEAANRREHDFIFVSQVMFGSGHIFDQIDELAALARPEGPWVVIDGYHAFMAIASPLGNEGDTNAGRRIGEGAFYLGGGYKYAMAGEGCAFMHAPPNFGSRPWITGWFAEFEDISLPPNSIGFAKDASRFLGATFDPSGLYRFVAVRCMLEQAGLSTRLISDHTRRLQQQFLGLVDQTPLASAELLNPIADGPHARFLAYRTERAEALYAALKLQNCITDVRSDVLRIGFGLYHDEQDVELLSSLLRGLS
ncbi:MAG TPA: class V aminotransferase [Sphingomicrobium sp.]|nr:class V aminotransferase [Sphingomicrobium sp.]